MRILELLHGRTLREDGTDLTEPVSPTGISIAPGAGTAPPPAQPPGFGTILPGYSKDAAGNWTNPQGRAPNALLGSGNMRYAGWEVPVSAAAKTADQQGWGNALDQYATKGNMTGINKMLGGR